MTPKNMMRKLQREMAALKRKTAEQDQRIENQRVEIEAAKGRLAEVEIRTPRSP